MNWDSIRYESPEEYEERLMGHITDREYAQDEDMDPRSRKWQLENQDW